LFDHSQRDMNLAVDPTFYDLLAGSYTRFFGAPLVPLQHDIQVAARWLYEEAPYCVLAHNTDPDPVFIYGNKAAQACFEYTWDELTSLRSQLSAENTSRQERQRLPDVVQRRGFPLGTGDFGLPSPEDVSGSRT
jgi:MEKHLA domain